MLHIMLIVHCTTSTRWRGGRMRGRCAVGERAPAPQRHPAPHAPHAAPLPPQRRTGPPQPARAPQLRPPAQQPPLPRPPPAPRSAAAPPPRTCAALCHARRRAPPFAAARREQHAAALCCVCRQGGALALPQQLAHCPECSYHVQGEICVKLSYDRPQDCIYILSVASTSSAAVVQQSILRRADSCHRNTPTHAPQHRAL